MDRSGPSKNTIIGWGVGMLAALALTWFIGAWVWPLWQVRTTVTEFRSRLASRGRTWSPYSMEPLAEARAFLPFLGDGGAVRRLGGPDAASKKLLRYLQSPRPVAPHKIEAAMLLCYCGRLAIPAMLRALGSDEEEVRVYGAVGIGLAGGDVAKQCIPALLQALEDPSVKVRMAATAALGEMGPAAVDAIPALEKAVKTNIVAVKALGRIAGVRAMKSLEIALKNGQDVMVVQTAAEVLGEIGKPAVEVLISALRHRSPDVRRSAAEALGAIKDTRALRPLTSALKDADWSVRLRAANALGEIGNASAVESLEAVLADKKANVRQAAADALKMIRKARER